MAYRISTGKKTVWAATKPVFLFGIQHIGKIFFQHLVVELFAFHAVRTVLVHPAYQPAGPYQ